MITAEEQIRTLVDTETGAWNTRDANALVSLFHPDTVWPWPPHAAAHDPMQWVMPFGKFDRERWRSSWQALFDTHDLVHNKRGTLRLVVPEHGNTLWRNRATRHSVSVGSFLFLDRPA